MNIVIINHNGGSPNHGPNLRTYYIAKSLVLRGHTVRIISSSYSHKYKNPPQFPGIMLEEDIDGIRYTWIKNIKYKSLYSRVLSHFIFAYKILKYRKKIFSSEMETLIFSGPPPEIFISCLIIGKLYSLNIVSDIRDLWPSVQLNVSKWYWLHPYTYLLFFSQGLIFYFSDLIVSPLPGLRDYLRVEKKRNKVEIIENGFDLTSLPREEDVTLNVVKSSPKVAASGSKISTQNLRDCESFIVGYSGSFDTDNDTYSLMKAARNCDNDKILFVFVGDGIALETMLHEANGLDNVLICEKVAPRKVVNVIRAFDICYCGLRNKKINRYGVALAKTFEYMAAAKPLIWMISAPNNPINDGAGGKTVEPENVDDLLLKLDQIVAMGKEELLIEGQKSFHFLAENNSYDVLGEKWDIKLREIGSVGNEN